MVFGAQPSTRHETSSNRGLGNDSIKNSTRMTTRSTSANLKLAQGIEDAKHAKLMDDLNKKIDQLDRVGDIEEDSDYLSQCESAVKKHWVDKRRYRGDRDRSYKQ